LNEIFWFLVFSPLLAANIAFAENKGADSKEYQKQIKAGENDLIVSIEPVYDFTRKNKLSLVVEITFRGDESGKTPLLIPDKFGDMEIENCYRNLKILSPNCSLEENSIPNQKVINYPPKSIVTYNYEIFDVRTLSEINLSSRYQPILNENYFHIFGETFFILPMTSWDREYNIKIIWKNLPNNWSIASSFGTYRSSQSVKMNLWDFRQSVFMGGNNIRILTKYVAGRAFYIAMKGNFQFTDNYLSDFLWSVVQEARSFWNDPEQYNYLVTILSVDDNYAYLSEGRVNSFSLFMGLKKGIDYNVKKMIAHEVFKNWLGRTIQPEEPKEIVSWFFSGFGEYYARLMLLRAGKINLEEYVDSYNSILEKYAKSPYRNESSTQMNQNYISNSDFASLQYYKGDIIAHNLNSAIFNFTSGGKNLDDFMLDLLDRTKKENLQISNGVLSAMIRFYAGEKTLSEVMGSVNSGKILKPHPDALGRCSVLRMDYSRSLWIFGERYEVYSYVFNNKLFMQNKDEFLKWFNKSGD